MAVSASIRCSVPFLNLSPRCTDNTSTENNIIIPGKNMKTPYSAYLRTGLACVLITLALSQTGLADTTRDQQAVIVTATRLDDTADQARGFVTVISREQIEANPAQTLPQLLSQQAGVTSRSLFGNNGSRATVDMRGFGATSGQNTLILLDGRRLNDIDFSSIDYSAIPMQNIERIEIIRGGGGVLYGDGAVGGVINIITRTPEGQGYSSYAELTAGSYSHQEVNAQLNNVSGPWSMRLALQAIDSDGYRDNNDLQQRNLQGNVRYSGVAQEWYMNFSVDDQELRLPGERRVNAGTGLNELDNNRRGTGTPNDFADQDGYQFTLGTRFDINDNIDAIIDFGYRNKDQQAFFDDYAFGGAFSRYIDTNLSAWSATPRINLNHSLFGQTATTIAGIDYYDSSYDSDRSQNESTSGTPVHRVDMEQQSTAVYVDTSSKLSPATSYNVGARLQWVNTEANDKYDASAPGGAFDSEAPGFDRSDRVHMLEAGLRHKLQSGLVTHAKAARSVRVATLDELYEFNSSFSRVFSPLNPQTATGIDLGLSLKRSDWGSTVNIYYQELKNEIHFSPATFSNINLDPTRRKGIELAGHKKISNQLTINANYTYMISEFRGGVFDGNDVPLVPRKSASIQASWQATPDTQMVVVGNYTGSKYFDNDQTNDFGQKIPSYSWFDLQVNHNIGNWKLKAAVNNLFDNEAYDYGVRSTFTPGRYNAYPLPERSYAVSVSGEF